MGVLVGGGTKTLKKSVPAVKSIFNRPQDQIIPQVDTYTVECSSGRPNQGLAGSFRSAPPLMAANPPTTPLRIKIIKINTALL